MINKTFRLVIEMFQDMKLWKFKMEETRGDQNTLPPFVHSISPFLYIIWISLFFLVLLFLYSSFYLIFLFFSADTNRLFIDAGFFCNFWKSLHFIINFSSIFSVSLNHHFKFKIPTQRMTYNIFSRLNFHNFISWNVSIINWNALVNKD